MVRCPATSTPFAPSPSRDAPTRARREGGARAAKGVEAESGPGALSCFLCCLIPRRQGSSLFSETHPRNLKEGPSAWDWGAILQSSRCVGARRSSQIERRVQGAWPGAPCLRGAAPSLGDENLGPPTGRVLAGLGGASCGNRRSARGGAQPSVRPAPVPLPEVCISTLQIGTQSQSAAARGAGVEKGPRTWPGGGGLETVSATGYLPA